jgi:transposase
MNVFIEHFLVPQLWAGAVVVMDRLPAHKLAKIEPLIQAVGASVLNLSPYSPDFNPIELWWSQLKAFLRQFSPTTTNMVDVLLATALDLVNPVHLRNWESQLLLLYFINLEYAVVNPVHLRNWESQLLLLYFINLEYAVLAKFFGQVSTFIFWDTVV